jgi:hypothetical protein
MALFVAVMVFVAGVHVPVQSLGDHSGRRPDEETQAIGTLNSENRSRIPLCCNQALCTIRSYGPEVGTTGNTAEDHHPNKTQSEVSGEPSVAQVAFDTSRIQRTLSILRGATLTLAFLLVLLLVVKLPSSETQSPAIMLGLALIALIAFAGTQLESLADRSFNASHHFSIGATNDKGNGGRGEELDFRTDCAEPSRSPI